MRKITVSLCLVLTLALVSITQGGCPNCRNGALMLGAGDPPLIVNGGWQYFNWNVCGQVFNIEGPFTFSSTTDVVLRVTDAYCTGDQFRVYDNGTPIGDTNFVPSTGECDVSDPDAAWADSRYTHGSFPLSPGSHSITIQVIVNDYCSGTANLRADSPPTSPQVRIFNVQRKTPSLLPLAETNIAKATRLLNEVGNLLSQAKEKNLDTAACEKLVDEAKADLSEAKARKSPTASNNFALQAIARLKDAIVCLKALLG